MRWCQFAVTVIKVKILNVTDYAKLDNNNLTTTINRETDIFNVLQGSVEDPCSNIKFAFLHRQICGRGNKAAAPRGTPIVTSVRAVEWC